MARVQRAGRKLQPTPARTTQNLLDIPFRVLRVRLLVADRMSTAAPISPTGPARVLWLWLGLLALSPLTLD